VNDTAARYFAAHDLLSPRFVGAHGVWLDPDELGALGRAGAALVHCPGSNLKLGSGIAPVPEMRARGITVSLGADGAACNNRLDMFTEMRTAALLQKVRQGPEALPASRALRMATIYGAGALGLEKEIGTLEVGKRADVIVVDLNRPHSSPRRDVVSALVYSAQPSDVTTTIIDGRIVMREGKLLTLDEAIVIDEANREASALAARAGLST
jgi:5-methylthioadenosine/S-adenosylhomocysteine deaminase